MISAESSAAEGNQKLGGTTDNWNGDVQLQLEDETFFLYLNHSSHTHICCCLGSGLFSTARHDHSSGFTQCGTQSTVPPCHRGTLMGLWFNVDTASRIVPGQLDPFTLRLDQDRSVL